MGMHHGDHRPPRRPQTAKAPTFSKKTEANKRAIIGVVAVGVAVVAAVVVAGVVLDVVAVQVVANLNVVVLFVIVVATVIIIVDHNEASTENGGKQVTTIQQ